MHPVALVALHAWSTQQDPTAPQFTPAHDRVPLSGVAPWPWHVTSGSSRHPCPVRQHAAFAGSVGQRAPSHVLPFPSNAPSSPSMHWLPPISMHSPCGVQHAPTGAGHGASAQCVGGGRKRPAPVGQADAGRSSQAPLLRQQAPGAAWTGHVTDSQVVTAPCHTPAQSLDAVAAHWPVA